MTPLHPILLVENGGGDRRCRTNRRAPWRFVGFLRPAQLQECPWQTFL